MADMAASDPESVEPFLNKGSPVEGEQYTDGDATNSRYRLTATQAWCLYTSHFLSMWMSRTYEYGAILFMQSAFPGTLLPSSLYGTTETLTVLVSGPVLGRWIDRSNSRLRPLLLTIFGNRSSLVLSCLLWLALFALSGDGFRKVVFAIILLLSMVEKSSRMANILSMERDWVPILANTPATGASKTEYDLVNLNTTMRRIDIICKLVAPLVFSAYVVVIGNEVAAGTLALLGTLSVGVECWAVLRVWKQDGRLHQRKDPKQSGAPSRFSFEHKDIDAKGTYSMLERLMLFASWLRRGITPYFDGLAYYFSTEMWVPSVCMGVLHGSVLTWSGTLVTWILNAGVPLEQVTVARGIGAVFDFSSTIAFPLGVRYLSHHVESRAPNYVPLQDHDGDIRDGSSSAQEHSLDSQARDLNRRQQEPELVRSIIQIAYYSIIGLVVALVPTLVSTFYMDSRLFNASSPQTLLTASGIAFIAFLSFSFLGRWTYDFSVMQLGQMLIPATHRSRFGGTEQMIVSCISLVHWVAAAIWHEQRHFKWLALGSFVAVSFAAAGYGRWTLIRLKRRRR